MEQASGAEWSAQEMSAQRAAPLAQQDADDKSSTGGAQATAVHQQLAPALSNMPASTSTLPVQTAANSVAKLPEQLLHLILSHCRVKEVCRLAQTCRSLRAAACHDPLWRKLAEADLSCLPCFATDESRWKLIEFCETELLGRQTGPVWREVYRRRSMLPSTVVVDVVRPQGPL